MNRMPITIFILAILSLSSCSKDESKGLIDFSAESIAFTQLCGWCTGSQGIIITDIESVEFIQTYNCSPESNYKMSRPLTEDEIQKLTDALELETIFNIDLDACGACYDGCDETLKIDVKQGSKHQIRFDQFDEYNELKKIESLIETLQDIRASFF